MSDLYEINRALRDIQGRTANLDHRLAKLIAPSNPAASGDRFFKLATAFVFRLAGNSDRAARIERSVASPATTTVAGWAQELTSTTVGGLLLSIAKQSAYAALAARTPAFMISPDVQRVLIGGEILCGFIAEGQAIGVQQGAFSSQTLVPKKISSIAVFSEEMELASKKSRRSCACCFLLGLRPHWTPNSFRTRRLRARHLREILAGIVATPASTATPASEALCLDLEALIAALGSPTDPVFVVSPSRLVYATATLANTFAYPVLASGSIPADRIICVDAGALIAAHAPEPKFSTSKDASLHMSDVPLPLISGVSQPPTLAEISTPQRSMFGEDLIALRTVLTISWVLRAGGVSFIDEVTW